MAFVGGLEMYVPQAPPGQTEFLVSVPPGTMPGTAIQTATPDGQLLTFAVPDDFVDGQMIPVFYTPLGRQPTNEIGVEPPPEAPRKRTKAEMRIMLKTFGDAKDRWKIDGRSMKGFYLHSESGYLYCWDQPRGILYEYEQDDGVCHVVWKAALPTVNAAIWQVLPLPPTDPASLQAAQTQSGCLPNADVYLVLTIAHEAGSQLPDDVLAAAAEEFCSRLQLHSRASQRLRRLPPAGQHFIIQNFRCEEDEQAKSEALLAYVDKLLRRPRLPWGNSACTLVVHSAGAIIGRSCPDLDALCRDDPPERLAQAHCKIVSDNERFFVCDLNTAAEGTDLDGFAVNESWVGPLKTGSLLSVGPLRIKIQLSDMAKDTPVSAKRPLETEEDEDAIWQQKVHQTVKKEERLLAEKQRQLYKDRAEERRQRTKAEAGSIAIDSLVNKFQHIREAERLADEAEERRVEMPTMEAHREANMATDGSFLGVGGFERAGIGFHSSVAAELIPPVLDPRSLSAQDRSRLKTQLRYDQAHG